MKTKTQVCERRIEEVEERGDLEGELETEMEKKCDNAGRKTVGKK